MRKYEQMYAPIQLKPILKKKYPNGTTNMARMRLLIEDLEAMMYGTKKK